MTFHSENDVSMDDYILVLIYDIPVWTTFYPAWPVSHYWYY